jgi:hypothetical protein
VIDPFSLKVMTNNTEQTNKKNYKFYVFIFWIENQTKNKLYFINNIFVMNFTAMRFKFNSNDVL